MDAIQQTGLFQQLGATQLTAIVGLLVALSAASERLVEIVKGVVPYLSQQYTDPKKEGRRRAALQVMAVAAGIVTALLARPTLPQSIIPADTGVFPVLALGLLASGGSGLWNAILSYLLKLKDLKKAEIERLKRKKAGG